MAFVRSRSAQVDPEPRHSALSGGIQRCERGGTMKPTSISAEALFEAHREALHWEWVAGHAHPERRFDDDAVRDARSAADLVGYLN